MLSRGPRIRSGAPGQSYLVLSVCYQKKRISYMSEDKHRARAGSISGCVFFSARATLCPLYEHLSLHMLYSWRALFEEGAFTSVPCGPSPAFAEAEQRLCLLESQMDQVGGMEMGEPLSSSFPTRSSAHSLGSEACPAVSSPRREGSTLCLSSSEEVDVDELS